MEKAKAIWTRWRYLIVAVGLVVLAWLANMFAPCLWGKCSLITDTTSLGAIGDRFGMVNALFSGLSLAGIIWAIHQQEQQLSLARDELKSTQDMLALARADADKTREILDNQTEQMAAQNAAAAQARFEQGLVSQIDIFFKIENAAFDTRQGVPITGRSVFMENTRYIDQSICLKMDNLALRAFHEKFVPICLDMFDILCATGDTIDENSENFQTYRRILLSCVSPWHLITMVILGSTLGKPEYLAFCSKFSAFEFKKISDDRMQGLTENYGFAFLSENHRASLIGNS